jgi:hypothetical protein
MGEIVNLNKRRKQAQRLHEKRVAAEKRRKFGRSRAEREKEKAEAERAARVLDLHRLDK